MIWTETQVKFSPRISGDHIGCARTAFDIRDLKCSCWEVLVAVIPVRVCESAKNVRQPMNGVVGQMRVRDVPLPTEHGEHSAQRSPATVLDRVAQGFRAGRLTDHAMVDHLLVLAEPIELRLSQSIIYARGDIVSYLFIDRPIASVFLLAGIAWILGMIFRRTWRQYRPAA